MSSPESPTVLRGQKVPGSRGGLYVPAPPVGKEEDGFFEVGGSPAEEREQVLCQVDTG